MMAFRHSFRRELGVQPIAERMLPIPGPVYTERYLFPSGTTLRLRGRPVMCLVTLFDGAQVLEGPVDRDFTNSFPGQSALVPPRCATQWKLSGIADAGIFYMMPPYDGPAGRLFMLASSCARPLPLVDALVGCTARYVFHEMAKGDACDGPYVESLLNVLLEQSFRSLSTPEILLFSPRHVHFRRLQKVLIHIRNNLTGNLSIDHLAQLAGVSETHFRRLFQDALKVPVHRYILAVRLERARQLLSMSSMPLVRVAAACGFADQSHLTARFRLTHGVTPATYRKSGGSKPHAR